MSSQPSDPKPASSQPSSKTPVTLHPTAHIADGAYVKGTHPITIGANTLVHPRAYILSIHAPLIIQSNTLIHTKTIIGAPLPTSTSTTNISDPTHSRIPPATPNDTLPTSAKPVRIGSHTQIHPHVTIHHSTSISDYAIIEPHVTLLPGAHIGAHSKICSGVTISSTIPEWTVVFGNGEMRRLRRPLSSISANTNGVSNETDSTINDTRSKSDNASKGLVDIELAEKQRIVSLTKEREAATTILRNNAKYLNVARQKAQQKEGGREEKVR